jgi:hypothetical protein
MVEDTKRARERVAVEDAVRAAALAQQGLTAPVVVNI